MQQNSDPPESISWSVRLSDKEPQKLWVVFLAAIFAGLAGIYFLHSPVLGIVGFLAILGTSAEFWLGSKYRLDNEQASARCGISISSIEWKNVRRVIVGQEGIKLSPLEESGRLGPFRGVMLRIQDEATKTKVLDWIKRVVGKDVRFVEGGAE
jgi:hypothetical protein